MSRPQTNVDGIYREPFQMYRGVKQGCPLSAALYILAISPLLNKIRKDTKIKGTGTIKEIAYADDVAIKKSKETK